MSLASTAIAVAAESSARVAASSAAVGSSGTQVMSTRDPAGVGAAVTVGDGVVEPSRSDPTEVGVGVNRIVTGRDRRRTADRTGDRSHGQGVAVGVGVVGRRAAGTGDRQVRSVSSGVVRASSTATGATFSETSLTETVRLFAYVAPSRSVARTRIDSVGSDLEVEGGRGQQLLALDR